MKKEEKHWFTEDTTMAPVQNKPVIVRRVYAEDLMFEFALIRSAIADFPLVSFDTEFPGTIFKADKPLIRMQSPVVNYQLMKANVDSLKIIQLGLSLSDSDGNLPDFGTPNSFIWEFNFKDFDVRKDYQDEDSIQLLKQQGIDFAKNAEKGIDSRDFAKLFLTSGLLYNRSQFTWVTFHGTYDFGFLLKILTQMPLPGDFHSFLQQIEHMFGFKVYDIKCTFRLLGMHGGLEKMAKNLNVCRAVGESHQAGSDSLITLHSFVELKKTMHGFNGSLFLRNLFLYGLAAPVHVPLWTGPCIQIPVF